MVNSIRRSFQAYGAIASMAIKAHLAYNLWFWADSISTIGMMIIFTFFWRAVYTQTDILGGLKLNQTISYILLARILAPLVETRTIFFFGFLIREGQIASELTRPLNFQFRYLVENLAETGIFLIQRIPIFLIAWLLLGLQLPSELNNWVYFIISLILGQLIVFLFDWTFACIAFYTTETWGLSVMRLAVGSFFGGALIPLTMMPDWLQKIAAVLPFSQVIAVPVSFLGGLVPPEQVSHFWVVQLIWVVVMIIISKLVFNYAVQKITVQGG